MSFRLSAIQLGHSLLDLADAVGGLSESGGKQHVRCDEPIQPERLTEARHRIAVALVDLSLESLEVEALGDEPSAILAISKSKPIPWSAFWI